MECRELTDYAIGRLLGEADGQREELGTHLSACARCREEIATIEETWETLGADLDLPLTPEFRARTLELLDDEVARRRIRAFRPRPQAVRVLSQAAALLVAVAAGFFAARGTVGTKPSSPAIPVQVGGAAASGQADLAGNPRLSNVSYRSDASGEIGIAFDATTRHSVVGRPEDPQVSHILAYLLSRNSETAGEKSRAIELVSGHYRAGASSASPEIVRALATTLRRDKNPGVRKKAAEALASFRMTPDVRSAFLEALASDPNPAVRLVAIEALAAAASEGPDPATIESLREKASDPAENGFVRAKAASALKAINL